MKQEGSAVFQTHKSSCHKWMSVASGWILLHHWPYLCPVAVSFMSWLCLMFYSRYLSIPFSTKLKFYWMFLCLHFLVLWDKVNRSIPSTFSVPFVILCIFVMFHIIHFPSKQSQLFPFCCSMPSATLSNWNYMPGFFLLLYNLTSLLHSHIHNKTKATVVQLEHAPNR